MLGNLNLLIALQTKFVVGQGLEVVESSGWFADLAWHVNLSQERFEQSTVL